MGIGIVGGKFKIAVENSGWMSRGTLISKREIQVELVNSNKGVLFDDEDGSAWVDLEQNRKKGWDFEYARRLSSTKGIERQDVNLKYGQDRHLQNDCIIDGGDDLQAV